MRAVVARFLATGTHELEIAASREVAVFRPRRDGFNLHNDVPKHRGCYDAAGALAREAGIRARRLLVLCRTILCAAEPLCVLSTGHASVVMVCHCFRLR